MKKDKQRGFTLIELSIVLLIISLITGSIVAGRSLIHSSRISALMQDINEYKTATNAFILQYNGFPGDITNATDYWPSLTSVGPQNMGNGDGVLQWETFTKETGLFFPELSLAGIIRGNYTFPTGAEWRLGVHMPETDFKEITLRPVGENRTELFTGVGYFSNIDGGGNSALTIITYQDPYAQNLGGLTPKDSYNIDVKLDDGMPGTGNVIGGKGFPGHVMPDCATSHSQGNMNVATYILDETDPNCVLGIILN